MTVRRQVTRVLLAAVASVSGFLITTSAQGQPQAASGVIVACVGPSGEMRASNGADGCKKNETPLTWNVQGQGGIQGPTGAMGSSGPAGPAGPEGLAGRDGRDGRDGGGNAPPAATVTAQMKIDGLNGNNPTPIFGFSLGATNSSSASGAGKALFANLVVTKMLDGDSVPLLQAAATGQVLRTVVIDVFAAGSGVPFATYTFDDVVVTSNVLGASNSAVNEQDAFDFRRITSDVTVNGQTFHSCFDIKAVTSCS
jgi:type VI protein secretion system component Hcp